MKTLRILGILAAILMMSGEAYRSWGAERPVYAWMDDMLAGTMMIAAALLVRRPTRARRCLFSAAWGVAVGMLYGSFFNKLFDPASAHAGNFDVGLLTWLLGFAFVAAIVGLVASIVLPEAQTSSRS